MISLYFLVGAIYSLLVLRNYDEYIDSKDFDEEFNESDRFAFKYHREVILLLMFAIYASLWLGFILSDLYYYFMETVT